MNTFFSTLRQIWKTASLRRRILFTVIAIIIFRIAAHVPVPGANLENLASIMDRNALLGVFSALTGGSVEQFSVVMMGVSPYITASIIIQLLAVVIPQLEALSKEGDQGRRQLNMYTRYLTVPFAFLQSYGMIMLLNTSGSQSGIPVRVISDTSIQNILFTMVVLVAGTIFLMWLGELIGEYGIGNGISMLIFAGILANVPTIVGSTLSLAKEDSSYIVPLIGIVIFTLVLIAIIVYISEGQRQVPITYAGRNLVGAPGTSHLPIRVNQAGMIPIIFAVSLISFPGLIASFFQQARSEWLRNLSQFILNQVNSTSVWYVLVYFILVVSFTFFYVNLTFKPEQVSENIQKRGGFVPGIRPGRETAEYLKAVSNRLTLLGATFLGVVAILPIIAQQVSTSLGTSGAPLLVSGAGLIIIVGVVLELVRQIKAQLVMQDYEKLY